jgi:hypothetical protein
MKLIALLFIPCLAISAPPDTVSVSRITVLQHLKQRHEIAEETFVRSLSLKQTRLKDDIKLIEGQLQVIDAIKQDSIKVAK